MTIPIEAYTAEAVVTGLVDATGGLREALETLDAIRIAPSSRLGLDGRSVELHAEMLAIDDLLLVVPDALDVVVHAAWHDLGLLVGPWRVDGLLATQPGFDPGRALARPGGTFIQLREARVALRTAPDRPLAVHESLLVNRYVVDEVECALSLPFHFPGATLRQVEPESESPPWDPEARSAASPTASDTLDPEGRLVSVPRG